MHYRLVRPRDPVTASILATVLDSIRRDPKLQADRERLTRACCQPNRFVTLQRAPQPHPPLTDQTNPRARFSLRLSQSSRPQQTRVPRSLA